MKHLKFRSILIVILFGGIIIFPFFNNYFLFFKDVKNYENRKMAECPSFDIKHLDKFPKLYDAYYNDNFSMRSRMVNWFNFLKLEIYKISPLPDQVLIGNDGWFYLKGNEYETFLGENGFSDSELREFKAELEFRRDYLEKRNCKFYFVIAPAKGIIYPNYIPNNLFLSAKKSHGEKLIEYLNRNSDISVVNVFSLLKEKAKDVNNPIYLKLDNHWNELAGFYASNEILSKISADFPTVKTSSISDFSISKKQVKVGNIIGMLNYDHNYTDINYIFKLNRGNRSVFVPKIGYPCPPSFPQEVFEESKEIKGSILPKLLLMTDSFGTALFPFLAEHFTRTEHIFDAWQYKLNEEIVQFEKPDVVVLVIFEAHLKKFLNHQSRKK